MFSAVSKKDRRIDKLLREHSRLEHDMRFSTDFFIGSMRGPRVRAELSQRIEAIEAEIEALEAE